MIQKVSSNLIRLLLLILLVGCGKPPEIRQYKIAKDRSDLGDIGMQQTETPIAQRMVVGIAEREDATWFLKVLGPKPLVDLSTPKWSEVFQSLNFGEDGKPTWETPDGWRLGPTKPMRFATLTNANGSLEIVISSLGPNQNMLDNVNRWRGQLDLAKISGDKLELGVKKAKFGELKLFDAVSEGSEGPGPTQATAEIKRGFEFQIAEGWIEGPTNPMVQLRLKRKSGTAEPQITVTSLSAAANKWLPNARRWAQQVAADSSLEAIQKVSSEIMIDGNPGNKIRLVLEEKEGAKALIGIMFVRDNLAWFLKFFGPRDQVIEFEEDFNAFVETFRFK
ncbi:MAG: hypothetical protein AAGA30_04635 [Planctomycetota bacterium]